MDDFTYTLALGGALGAYALVVFYVAAAWATKLWQRRRDRTRRFFIEAGGAALHAELRLAADELQPWQSEFIERAYDQESGTFRPVTLR
jgi:hypothetical protein